MRQVRASSDGRGRGRALSFRDEVLDVLNTLLETLVEKNARYGDAALRPLGIFGPPSPEAGLRVRIDDKLKRIQTGGNDNEDAILDLMGYLVLLRVWQAREKKNDGA